MKKALTFFLFSILLCAHANISQAQLSFGGNDAIDIKAEKATYRGGKTILSGNVRVKQKDALITADRMIILRAEKQVIANTANDQGDKQDSFIKLGNIESIIATGNFKYTTGDTSVAGEKGVYERSKNIITVTNNAVYKQGNNSVKGNKMVFDLKTNKVRFNGSCTGRDCGKKERISISLGGKKKK